MGSVDIFMWMCIITLCSHSHTTLCILLSRSTEALGVTGRALWGAPWLPQPFSSNSSLSAGAGQSCWPGSFPWTNDYLYWVWVGNVYVCTCVGALACVCKCRTRNWRQVFLYHTPLYSWDRVAHRTWSLGFSWTVCSASPWDHMSNGGPLKDVSWVEPNFCGLHSPLGKRQMTYQDCHPLSFGWLGG